MKIKKLLCLVLATVMCITGTMFGASTCEAKSSWQWPLSGGRVGDGFGAGRGHTGVDILKSAGSDIYATKDGKVVYSTYHSEYGNLIVIKHKNGYYSFYSHCSKRKVKAGEEVEQGDKIATVGSTGRATANHLHFEIRKGGSISGKNNSMVFLLKPMNPMKKF